MKEYNLEGFERGELGIIRHEIRAEFCASDQHRPGVTYFGRFPGGYFGSAGVSGT